MHNKILIAAFACVSMIAAAQSDTNNTSAKTKDKAASTTPAQAPRDLASGQASGKRANPATTQPSQGVKSPRDLASGQSSGREASAPSVSEIVVTKKTTAQDDWQTPAKKESGGVRVAAADVNGDGKADAAAPKTEKRQHKPPVTFEKEVGPASPSK